MIPDSLLTDEEQTQAWNDTGLIEDAHWDIDMLLKMQNAKTLKAVVEWLEDNGYYRGGVFEVPLAYWQKFKSLIK